MIKRRLKRKKKSRVFSLLHLLLDLKITLSSGAGCPCTKQGWVLHGASGTGELREGQEGGRFLETAQGSLDKLPCLLCRRGRQGRAQNWVGVSLESSAAATAALLPELEPLLPELPQSSFAGLAKQGLPPRASSWLWSASPGMPSKASGPIQSHAW